MLMEFNVAQLLKEPVGATREYDLIAEPESVPEVAAAAPYTGHARLTNLGDGVMADVKMSTQVKQVCDRCLVEVIRPLEISFTEVFRPTVDIQTGNPLSIDAKEDPFTIDDSHTLDLTEALRQYAVIELPMSVVCREECKGLCPTCGIDLNEVGEGHAHESQDPRLAVLAELLTGYEDEEKE